MRSIYDAFAFPMATIWRAVGTFWPISFVRGLWRDMIIFVLRPSLLILGGKLSAYRYVENGIMLEEQYIWALKLGSWGISGHGWRKWGGLEKYGRNWDIVSSYIHVGCNPIESHAHIWSKYFNKEFYSIYIAKTSSIRESNSTIDSAPRRYSPHPYMSRDPGPINPQSRDSHIAALPLGTPFRSTSTYDR